MCLSNENVVLNFQVYSCYTYGDTSKFKLTTSFIKTTLLPFSMLEVSFRSGIYEEEILSLVLFINKNPIFSRQVIKAVIPHRSRASSAKGLEEQALFS